MFGRCDMCGVCGAKISRDDGYIFYKDDSHRDPPNHEHYGTYHSECFYILSGITIEEFWIQYPEVPRWERGFSHLVPEELWKEFTGV